MDAGTSAPTGTVTGLVGRWEESSRLTGLVNPPLAESQVLLILGDPGIGKTVLLASAVREARAAGMRVLAAAGRESEQDLAFAGLHQLLRPVLDHVAYLPARQAGALRGAFAISDDPVPPDALLTGIAVLTLLSGLSDAGPLLVAVDDAQWLDRGSLDALAFAARRLESERLVLLLGARGNVPPTGFDRDFPELPLQPLGSADASRLLDAQPHPPRGRAREQVLAQAAGNPMALIELSKVIAADPAAGRTWETEPIPLTDRLTAIMAAQFANLPGSTQAALLLVAVADSPDLAAAVPGLSPDALAPAEAAGLIRVGSSGPQFSHPLVRSAVYHAVPFAARAAAHLRIASALRDEPDRRAWHLAAAALEPDEQVASLLADTAVQAQRRGGAAAAARALERAAELSPSEHDQVRRLLAAAALALAAGQGDWVQELAARVLSATSDPESRITARLHIGWALAWSNRHAEALGTLISVAEEASARLPVIAWDAIGTAATVAYQSGIPAGRKAVLDTLSRMAEPAPQPPDWPAGHSDVQRVWIRACTGPFGERTETIPYLHRVAASPGTNLARAGVAAWLLDETELAVRLLREALSQLRAPGVRGSSAAALSALQWACVDSGRWDEALATAREAADIAAAYKMETVAVISNLTTATVLVMRGQHDQAMPLLASELAVAGADEYRSVAARARHAAGIAALADGDHVTAYAQLRQLFGTDDAPLHQHVPYLAIADFAAAAVRAGRRVEAQTLVENALTLAGPEPGVRLDQLAARARGLLAPPADAEIHFAKGLSDPDGETWPFERAQLRLDYGEWLRRRRRINHAKPFLTSALETFRRLGAAPWTRRAEAELRACGVITQARGAAPDALAGLTAQQREIITLAGRGLTNGEIADRLFLSPRTVASHLYRSYPKLGVAGRHQLRGLVDQPASPVTEPATAPQELARRDAAVPAADPVGDQAAVLPGRLLPREVTCVERMNLAVGEEVVEVLVVRPRHKVIVAPGHDLGRRGNRRQQVTQHRVLLGVMPDEPGRLRESPQVVGADVVLVHVGFGVARGTRLDRVADVGSGVQGAHHVQARRLDDVLERAARFDRKADRAAADGQARDALRRLRGKEERRGRADVRADDVGSSQAPFVDQASQELPRGVRGNQFRAAVGVAESGQVDGDHPAGRGYAVPDAAERPEAFGPRCQQQHGDVRICPGIGEPHAHPVTHSEVGGDRRRRLRDVVIHSRDSLSVGELAVRGSTHRPARSRSRARPRPRPGQGCAGRE
jgi:DNA-binding CsgD family transcriptional regulator